MKIIFFASVFVLFFEYSLCAVSISLPEKRKVCSSGKCIDYCNIDEINLMPGEAATYSCNLVRCNEDYSINFESCGTAATDDCRRFGPDTTLEYPSCCNKICLDPIVRRARPWIETNRV